MLPAAGYMALAIEALRQIHEKHDDHITGVTLRDVVITTALVIPDTDSGIEIQLRFQKSIWSNNSAIWYSFAVETISEGKWRIHCEGIITNHSNSQITPSVKGPQIDLSKLTQKVSGKRWYDAFDRVGFQYGPSFRNLGQVRTNINHHKAVASVQVRSSSGLMKGESRYGLHPSTVDACIQLVMVASNAGRHKEMPYGVVPIQLEEVSVWLPLNEVNSNGQAIAWTDKLDGRISNTQIQLSTASGQVILEMRNIRCIAYEAVVPPQASLSSRKAPYSATFWKPDITSLTSRQFSQKYSDILSEGRTIATLFELLDHKTAISKLLLMGKRLEAHINILRRKFRVPCSVIIADEKLRCGTLEDSAIDTQSISMVPEEWPEVVSMLPDLIIISREFTNKLVPEKLLSGIRALCPISGRVLLEVENSKLKTLSDKMITFGFSKLTLQLEIDNCTILVLDSTPLQNGRLYPKTTFVVLAGEPLPPTAKQLWYHLAGLNCNVEIIDLAHYHESPDQTLIICDYPGTLLLNATSETFADLQRILKSNSSIIWLTAGVNEGESIPGGMVSGFLRAVRSERASARIVYVDIDSKASPEFVGQYLRNRIGDIASKDGKETEFWLHEGMVYIPRVVENATLNEKFAATDVIPQDSCLSQNVALHGLVSNGDLTFCAEDLALRPAVGVAEVELLVTTSEFDQKDLQSGTWGPKLISGTVINAGDAAGSLQGKNVIAYTDNAYHTRPRVTMSVCAAFSKANASDLVATLPGLCKAVDAIINKAKTDTADHLLVLPAPLIFTTAALMLSLQLNFHFTVFVETEVDRETLANQFPLSRGKIYLSEEARLTTIRELSRCSPTVVVAHDFLSLSQDIWRSLPPMSRFVLVDNLVTKPLDPLPLTRGVSFQTSSTEILFRQDQKALGLLLKQTLKIIDEHEQLLRREVRTIDLGSNGDNDPLRFKSTSAQATLRFNYGQSRIQVCWLNEDFEFLSQEKLGTYNTNENSVLSELFVSSGRLLRRHRAKFDNVDAGKRMPAFYLHLTIWC